MSVKDEAESACQHTEVERIIYLGKSLPSANCENTSATANCAIIDHDKQCYPFCIVFMPLPILSWVVPLLGHYGIGTSDGRIRDFSGNYHIPYNRISYGTPTKYCQLEPSKARQGVRGWDLGIAAATNEYLKQHGKPVSHSKKRNPSYVAESLNAMQYDGRTNWNRIRLCAFMLRYSRYTGINGILHNWLPFVILSFVCGALIYVMWVILPVLEPEQRNRHHSSRRFFYSDV